MDQTELSLLYVAHQAAIVQSLAALTHSAEDAEDFLAEALARALEREETFTSPKHALAWLRRSARNLAIDEWRRRGRWRLRSSSTGINESAESVFLGASCPAREPKCFN